MKRITRIALSTLASIALLAIAGVGYLWITLFDPFVQPPEIGQGLPSSFKEADRVFKKRVAGAFKLGIAERDLITELTAQGFTVEPKQTAASFENASM